MPKVATWMRPKDEQYFRAAFAPHPEVKLFNAANEPIALEEIDGLLLTGGPDIAQEFLRQPVPDPSVIEDDCDPKRDAWEFPAIENAIARELPIFAICKGLQTLNVALGGTLRLDIPGHNLPEMKTHDVQPLRHSADNHHRFEKVNSSHHQAIDRLGDGLAVEAWCATDDIIEQVRLRDYPFALAVQYHPERGEIYGGLFAEFAAEIAARNSSPQTTR